MSRHEALVVAYIVALVLFVGACGWLLGLDHAAVSCQQKSEFSSEGVRYVCMPMPGTEVGNDGR